MSNKNSVAIKINQDNLLANLQFSFSNKTTLLGELLQNSRRAGATKVVLDSIDDTTLRISDDGKGIDDFQNLFSIAESGWDADIKKNERPFGMGFLSCLYQAEEIHIESNGRYIEGNTVQILSGGALNVYETSDKKDATYTTVTLFNFKLSKVDVESALKRLAEGFAIPVYYNGEELLSTHALNTENGAYVEVQDIGHIYVRDVISSPHRDINDYMVVYLQGLPVYDNRRWDRTSVDVIHLDSTLFNARLPDRDKLVDEIVVLEKIKTAINQIHLNRLLKFKADLPPEKFATRELVGYALAIIGGSDVLYQSDVNLSNYFYGHVAHEQPTCYSEADVVSSVNENESLSYAQVASGETNLCVIEQLNSWDEENNCAAAWIFARKMGWSLIDGFGYTKKEELLEKHWVSPFVHHINNDNIKVESNSPGKTGFIQLDYSSYKVELCDSYTITYTTKKGEVHVCNVDDEAVLTKDGVLLIPANANEIGSSAVMQGSSYESNEEYDGVAHEKDATALDLYVNMLRTGDEIHSLQQLLNTVFLGEYKEFVGNKYELVLDENCKVVLSKIAA